MHRAMCQKKPQMAWRNLPYNQEDIVSDILKTANDINGRFENFVVLGIGGSALGSKALFTALKHTHYNALSREKRGGVRFYVEDNVDPDRMNALFDVIDVSKTAFHVITKSGNTVETMSQFMIVLQMLKEKLGDGFKDNIVVTTDKEHGIMKKICNQYGFKTYIVPDGVGGRFFRVKPGGPALGRGAEYRYPRNVCRRRPNGYGLLQRRSVSKSCVYVCVCYTPPL